MLTVDIIFYIELIFVLGIILLFLYNVLSTAKTLLTELPLHASAYSS